MFTHNSRCIAQKSKSASSRGTQTRKEKQMTTQSLKELKFSANKVNVSKVYTVIFEAKSMQEAEEAVEEMCRRLLANPTKDNYTYTIEEAK